MPPNNQHSEQTSIFNSSELGVDAETLWQAADKLRGSIDAAEYKHVVLGLIFLKYISDAFETRREALKAELAQMSLRGLRRSGLWKVATNTRRRMSSGFHQKRAGRRYRPRARHQTSA